MSHDLANTATDYADLTPLKKWLREIQISASTVWRWRKAGRLKTVNIYGRIYITRKAREEFLARVEAGEFAQAPGSAR
jgi:predicted site-specific integrase-resolvase